MGNHDKTLGDPSGNGEVVDHSSNEPVCRSSESVRASRQSDNIERSMENMARTPSTNKAQGPKPELTLPDPDLEAESGEVILSELELAIRDTWRIRKAERLARWEREGGPSEDELEQMYQLGELPKFIEAMTEQSIDELRKRIRDTKPGTRP